MGISIKQFGKHKDVLFLDYGVGDILISPGAELDEDGTSMLIFSQQERGEIGREKPELKGVSTDEIENVKLVFRFKQPKSIAVLIGKLIEVQEALYDKEIQK